jgi:hypothetical protein
VAAVAFLPEAIREDAVYQGARVKLLARLPTTAR